MMCMERTYHDKTGKPLTQKEWAVLFETRGYREVARTQIGKDKALVSTVWNGDGQAGADGRALDFETAVFDNPFGDDSWTRRTATLAEAKEMHKAAVAWVKGKAPQPALTEWDLKAAEDRYVELAAKVEYARARRNRIVRDAVASGWTHARIANATGLTRARVGQIALTGEDR